VPEKGGWAGWSGSQGKIQIKLEFEFQGFWNLARLGKILQGDLEGIWRWEFFQNSSWFLTDLKKYNMPCHECNLRPY
jgi:hypothetical protein